MSNQQDNFTKGFLLGALIGGAAGAITALLLAPKSGVDLRRDLAEKSGEWYEKANEFAAEQGKVVGKVVNEGRVRAEQVVRTTKEQAGSILSEAETLLRDVRHRAEHFAGQAQHQVVDNVARIQDAAKVGVETFRSEMSKDDAPIGV
jgi:gas vesicle protein